MARKIIFLKRPGCTWTLNENNGELTITHNNTSVVKYNWNVSRKKIKSIIK